MNPHQIIAVGARLFSIWLLVYATTNIASTYFGANRHGVENALTPVVLSFGVLIAACGVLWLFPSVIARRILPERMATQDNTPLFEDWFSVGCSLIGVWVLSKAIPALASYLLINYMGQKIYPGSFVINPDWPLHVAFNILQLLFGTWLFLGAKGLRKALEWARKS